MLTYGPQTKRPGSSQITIDVNRDGRPYAQLWTFKARRETHPWHAKLAADMDSHATFYAEQGGLRAAKAYLETLAK